MDCARCKTPLTELGVAAGRALGCQACGGLWLDARATHGVLQKPDDLAKTAPKTRPEHDEATVLRCPVCDQPMIKVEMMYAQVDRCSVHGTWFDRGELQFIARQSVAAREEREAEALLSPGDRFAKNGRVWNEALRTMNDSAVVTADDRSSSWSDD